MSVDALAALADEHWNARRFQAAVDVYQRICRLAPNDPRPVFNVAMSLKVLGDLDGTVALLHRLASSSMNQ
jgi:Flp pilus assembly protein TadD